MRALRTYLAMAAGAGLIFLGLWALFALMRFGSCASGGAYVSARECAPGTGLKIVELTGSIFGTLIVMAVAATGGARAVWVVCAMIPATVASYFYVIAFATTLGAGSASSDRNSALIAGVVCTLIAAPMLVASVRPRRRGTPPGEILIDAPTGRVHIHTPEAGGPAAIVRANRRPND